MQSFDFKKYLPHLLIILGFALVSILFCLPAYKGMVLSQGDNISWKAMSHEAEAWHQKTGENTLWSNSMFGGMPTYTYYVPEGNNMVGMFPPLVTAMFKKPAQFIFCALVSFFILALVMKWNRWLSIAGAIAFAFSSYNVIILAAGHETKAISIAYIPAVIAGLILIYRGRYLGGGILYAFTLALLFGASHYQIIFYTAIILLFMVLGFLVNAVKQKQLKTFFIASAITLLGSAMAIGPSASGIWMTVLELNKETMRGGKSELTGHDTGKKAGGLDKDYAFQWSNGVGETLCILVPYLYGGSGDEPTDHAPEAAEVWAKYTGTNEHLPLYWGPQPFLSGPVYFGAIICFLFVLGMMVIKNPVKWWLLAASILGMFLGMGKNFSSFNYWFFDHVPLYNSFRTPSMALVIPQVIFPIVAIWGLMEVISNSPDKKKLWNNVAIAAGATAGLCLVLAFGGSAFFDFKNPASDEKFPPDLLTAIKEGRAALAMKSSLTSAVYILLAAAALWAFVKGKIKAEVMIAAVGLLIAIDLISVSSSYLNDDNYVEASDYEAKNFEPRPVDQQILQDPDPYYRVLDLTRDVYNDAHQAYFHKCVGGYSPAKLELYQDLIDRQMRGKFNSQVLNMLNTKYVIFKAGEQDAAQPLPGACGNAWFVNEIKWAQTADEEMDALNAPAIGDTTQVPNAFEPKKTAVMRATFKDSLGNFAPQKDSSSYVKLEKYGLNTISFVSDNSKEGLAVFSDVYYPHGWHATVDGKEVPILKADYLLRALKLPAGKHNIIFNFHPESFYTGDKISLISSLILYALIVLAIVAAFRKKKDEEYKEIELI